METPAETKKTPALSNKVVIIAATAVIAALAIVAFLLLSGRKENDLGIGYRSEERRVGKHCIIGCRSRWWP